MAWLDNLFSAEHRRVASARELFAEDKYDEALELLQTLESPQAGELRKQIQVAAAKLWLDEALDATDAGDGNRLRRVMARAGRYHHDEIDEMYRETDRKIRERRIRLTAPEHWCEVLLAAVTQRNEYFRTPQALGVPKYRVFASRRLLLYAGTSWATDPEGEAEAPSTDDIEAASPEKLTMLIDAIQTMYPDDLAETVPSLGAPFVRAMLQVANGRPDLATLPLLELPESDPLVCFERARVAHILGYPRTALLALQNFRVLVGDHRTIRRLNTGVFAAQMAVSIGDEARALTVIRTVPIRFLGKRPLALYARLLMNAGELQKANDVLEDHISRGSDNEDALLLLDETRTRLRDLHGGVGESNTWFDLPREVTAEVLINAGPLIDEDQARTTPEPIPRRSSRDWGKETN